VRVPCLVPCLVGVQGLAPLAKRTHLGIGARALSRGSPWVCRDWPVERLREVTPADAVKHPNWSMGKKITVGLATLMNKVSLRAKRRGEGGEGGGREGKGSGVRERELEGEGEGGE